MMFLKLFSKYINTIGIVLVNYLNFEDTIKIANIFLELNYPNIKNCYCR